VTGYTAKLVEDGQTFSEFVMTCASAFNPSIEDKFTPRIDPYHKEGLAEALKEVAKLKKMKETTRLAFGKAKRINVIIELRKAIKQLIEENNRVTRMERKVLTWEPPTPNHVPLKSFMMQQLGDCHQDLSFIREELRKVEKKTPLQFWKEALVSDLDGHLFLWAATRQTRSRPHGSAAGNWSPTSRI
jgi:regulator of replication initiation timing